MNTLYICIIMLNEIRDELRNMSMVFPREVKIYHVINYLHYRMVAQRIVYVPESDLFLGLKERRQLNAHI